METGEGKGEGGRNYERVRISRPGGEGAPRGRGGGGVGGVGRVEGGDWVRAGKGRQGTGMGGGGGGVSSPMSLRSSASGSAAHVRNTHTSLAICVTVGDVPSSYSTAPSLIGCGMPIQPPGK